MTLKELEKLVAPEYVVNTDAYDPDILWVVQSPACHPGKPVMGSGNDNGGYCYSDIYFVVTLDGDKIRCGIGDGYHRDMSGNETIGADRLKARLDEFYNGQESKDG